MFKSLEHVNHRHPIDMDGHMQAEMEKSSIVVFYLLGIGAVTVHMLHVDMFKTVARAGIAFYIQIHTQ